MNKNLLLNAIGASVSGLVGIMCARKMSKRKYEQGFNDGMMCMCMMHSIDEALRTKDVEMVDLNNKRRLRG